MRVGRYRLWDGSCPRRHVDVVGFGNSVCIPDVSNVKMLVNISARVGRDAVINMARVV